MKALYTITLLCLASLGYGQETTREIGDYNSLIVSRGVDVRLVKSNSSEAKITTTGIDPDDVIIESRGRELIIKITTKSLWQEMQDNHWGAKVELPYKSITNMEVSTGAKISSEEVFVEELLDVQTSMGGELELEVNLKELIIDSSMGALAELTGSVKDVDLSASMGSEVDLRGLIAENVRAKSSMGSEVKVHATKEFDGRANMGGYIRVTGDPEKFYDSTSMGGEISSK